MDVMANVLLAAGAAPAMVHSVAEVADFARVAGALLINVGTLDGAWVDGMHAAASAFAELGKPWVLDPVAAGATPHRTAVAVALARRRPTVIKGNASEVAALAAAMGCAPAVDGGAPRGVDSTLDAGAAVAPARALAAAVGCVVVVSGVTDYVASPPTAASPDGGTLAVDGGSALLPAVTATGCSLGALIAAFLAVAHAATPGGGDVLAAADGGRHARAAMAAAAAAATLGAAAAAAERGAAGPASFRTALIDALWSQTDSDVARLSVVRQVE